MFLKYANTIMMSEADKITKDIKKAYKSKICIRGNTHVSNMGNYYPVLTIKTRDTSIILFKKGHNTYSDVYGAYSDKSKCTLIYYLDLHTMYEIKKGKVVSIYEPAVSLHNFNTFLSYVRNKYDY